MRYDRIEAATWSLHAMKAIILAAGRGSRMKNLTDDRPKCLVELRGKPLLVWQLGALRLGGIDEIAIVTGYRHELLSGFELTKFHNPRWAETQMVSSLDCAREWLQSGSCIVSYSDIFYAESAVKSLVDSTADLAVTYDPNWLGLWSRRFGNPLLDAETFRLKSDGTLAEIGNRPESIDEVQGQYMGLLRVTPRGWDEVLHIRSQLSKSECDGMHMTATLQKIIEAGRLPIHGVRYEAEWGEVDSVVDLKAYETDDQETK